MAEDDFFDHSTPEQVENFGYDWKAWGENIAAGHQTPESVVQDWVKSPTHADVRHGGRLGISSSEELYV